MEVGVGVGVGVVMVVVVVVVVVARATKSNRQDYRHVTGQEPIILFELFSFIHHAQATTHRRWVQRS